MKAHTERVTTTTYELTPEDIQKLIVKEICAQYGVEIKYNEVEFDIEERDDGYGYSRLVFNGATYRKQTRT